MGATLLKKSTLLQPSDNGTYVPVPATPADGHTLVWSAAQGKYLDGGPYTTQDDVVALTMIFGG